MVGSKWIRNDDMPKGGGGSSTGQLFWLVAGAALGFILGCGMTAEKLEAHAPACEEVRDV